MNLGVDVGSYYTKTSKEINFLSKVSFLSNSLDNKDFIYKDDKKIFLGEGEFDTEYRKAYREDYLLLLQGAIEKSTSDKRNRVVVGLPLIQYQEDKEYLINRILQSKLVDDVEVVPEGVLTVPGEYEGMVIDIGGRTTDICMLVNENGIRKVRKPISIPKGALNLENEFINRINKTYGLALTPLDAEWIIKNGLFIYGKQQPVDIEVFKDFVEDIVRKIQIDYSIKTNNVVIVGGGSELLYKPFKSRIPQLYKVKNAFYSNALAYGRYAQEVFRWRK